MVRKKVEKAPSVSADNAIVGRTAYDLAWMLYTEITSTYPAEFKKPFDHQWCLTKCVEAATLELKEGDKLKKIALSQIDTTKTRN